MALPKISFKPTVKGAPVPPARVNDDMGKVKVKASPITNSVTTLPPKVAPVASPKPVISYKPDAPVAPPQSVIGDPMGAFPHLPINGIGQGMPVEPQAPAPPALVHGMTPEQVQYTRQHETFDQRLDRLKGYTPSPNLDARIARDEHLRDFEDKAGKTEPRNYLGPATPPTTPPPVPTGDVQPPAGNNPFPAKTGPLTSADLSEQAPPRGFNTFFEDRGNSTQEKSIKKDAKATLGLKGKGSGGTSGGSTYSGGGSSGGGSGTGSWKDAPAVKDLQAKFDAAKAGGASAEKLARIRAKLQAAKKEAKGAQSNLDNTPQAGSRERPFINRGVTYNPLGYGGKLRV